MIGTRYMREARQLARLAAMDPVEAWFKFQARVIELPERLKPLCPYQANHDWERRLHESLGVSWPCEATAEFWPVWHKLMEPFIAQGVRIGAQAFGGWGDAEPAVLRGLWCLTRHLRPEKIIETGVARGMTSQVVLAALERNGTGHLWSIDLPPPLYPEVHSQIGSAVEDRLRHRWTYIKGSSRRRLPGLLAETGSIDLFIHDSMHSAYNVRFELDRAWAALKPGGVALIDDIDVNWGFHSFMQEFPGHLFLICFQEPVEHAMPHFFNGKGLFGIARKGPGADSSSI